MKTAILMFVIQVDAVKTFGPVRSIDDLVRAVSTAVSENVMTHHEPSMAVRISTLNF